MYRTLRFFLCLAVACACAQADIVVKADYAVDVRPVENGARVYPQNTHMRYGELPACLEGLSCATGLLESTGNRTIRAQSPCTVFVAARTAPEGERWRHTGGTLAVGKRSLGIYRADIAPDDGEISLPKRAGEPSLIFSKKISVATPKPPADAVIAEAAPWGKRHITDPNLLIRSDGAYLASCVGAGIGGVHIFISEDKGETWAPLACNVCNLTFATLFEHNGALYLLGTVSPLKDPAGTGYIGITRSDDGGATWTPIKDGSGVLRKGAFHSAPVPVVVHGGRLWRGMETRDYTRPKAPQVNGVLAMSAPETSDLLDPKSWTFTNVVPCSKSEFIEGNVVETPQGDLALLLRRNEYERGGTAGLFRILGAEKLDAEPLIVDMPGAAKKFTVRFDKKSGLYWALTNPVFPKDRQARHGGFYKKGVHCGLVRNHLALVSSPNLRDWEIRRIVLESDNVFFHGFQYASWDFDGDDIVAVCRTAYDDPRGLPPRQHDANFLTFHRVKNFRGGAK